MSKLQVGRTYVARNGDWIRIIGGDASKPDKPVEYKGTVINRQWYTLRYTEDGVPVGEVEYVTDNYTLVDMVDGEGKAKDPTSIGAPSIKRPEPGEGVAITTGDSVPRDDDPVHPQDDEEEIPVTPQTLKTAMQDVLRRAPPPTSVIAKTRPSRTKLAEAVLKGQVVQVKRVGNTEWEDMRNRVFAIRMLLTPHTPHEFQLKPKEQTPWQP